MGVQASVWQTVAVVLFAVLPLLSLAFAVLVLAKSPRSFCVRIFVAAATVAIGFAPIVIVWLALTRISWFPGD